MLAPFIIYWDITPQIDDEITLRICDELTAANIFVLNLRDVSTPISKVTTGILNRMRAGRIKINLTVKYPPPDTIGSAGLSKLYLEFDRLEDLQASLPEISGWIDKGLPVGLSFYLSEENFKEIPSVLSFCIDNNINDLKFPIQRVDEGRIYYPDPETASRVGKEIRSIPIDRLNLTIHDPFIWQLVHSRDNPNEGGCNGARTMMYISHSFDVTPCPIFPVSMGNLRNLSLKDIFSSEKRREMREELSSPPKECGGCPAVRTCIGGCRGRTYVLYEGFDKQDPACNVAQTR